MQACTKDLKSKSFLIISCPALLSYLFIAMSICVSNHPEANRQFLDPPLLNIAFHIVITLLARETFFFSWHQIDLCLLVCMWHLGIYCIQKVWISVNKPEMHQLLLKCFLPFSRRRSWQKLKSELLEIVQRFVGRTYSSRLYLAKHLRCNWKPSRIPLNLTFDDHDHLVSDGNDDDKGEESW